MFIVIKLIVDFEQNLRHLYVNTKIFFSVEIWCNITLYKDELIKRQLNTLFLAIVRTLTQRIHSIPRQWGVAGKHWCQCCNHPNCKYKYTIGIPYDHLCSSHSRNSCPNLWMNRSAWLQYLPRNVPHAWCRIWPRGHWNSSGAEYRVHRSVQTIRHTGRDCWCRMHHTRNIRLPEPSLKRHIRQHFVVEVSTFFRSYFLKTDLRTLLVLLLLLLRRWR